MPPTQKTLRLLILAGIFISLSVNCFAQNDMPESIDRPMTRKERRAEEKRLKNMPVSLPELSRDGFKVSGGQRAAVKRDSTELLTDSISQIADSMLTGSGRLNDEVTVIRDSTVVVADSVSGEGFMSLSGTVVKADSSALANMPPRQRRLYLSELNKADTTLYAHSPLFRDTMSLSKLTLISFVAPGFSQLYNGDYYKIPVLYAAAGTSLYFGIKEHRQYRRYKNEYDALTLLGNTDRSVLDPLQTKMIQHNTWRQLLFLGAIGSYIYFIGDGMMNYPHSYNYNIKIATILSTLCPGAGQIYNGSYWKVPIMIGGLASMAYVVDWNNRIYQRSLRAYHTAILENNTGAIASAKSIKDSNRRARDLSIIITAAFYLFNIMDAYVDAHLQDYDVSDDLAARIRVTPEINSIYTQSGGITNTFGLSLNVSF